MRVASPGGDGDVVEGSGEDTAGTLDGDGEEGCVLVFTGTTTAYSYVSAGGPFFSEQTKYYQSPKIHHIDVGPLQPGTEYYYQVGRAAAPDSPEARAR